MQKIHMYYANYSINSWDQFDQITENEFFHFPSKKMRIFLTKFTKSIKKTELKFEEKRVFDTLVLRDERDAGNSYFNLLNQFRKKNLKVTESVTLMNQVADQMDPRKKMSNSEINTFFESFFSEGIFKVHFNWFDLCFYCLQGVLMATITIAKFKDFNSRI